MALTGAVNMLIDVTEEQSGRSTTRPSVAVASRRDVQPRDQLSREMAEVRPPAAELAGARRLKAIQDHGDLVPGTDGGPAPHLLLDRQEITTAV